MNKKSFVFHTFIVATCIMSSVSLVHGMDKKETKAHSSKEQNQKKKLKEIVGYKDTAHDLIIKYGIVGLRGSERKYKIENVREILSKDETLNNSLMTDIFEQMIELLRISDPHKDSLKEILSKINLLLKKELEFDGYHNASEFIACATMEKLLSQIGFKYDNQGEFAKCTYNSNHDIFSKKDINLAFVKFLQSINPVCACSDYEKNIVILKTKETNLDDKYRQLWNVINFMAKLGLKRKEYVEKERRKKLDGETQEVNNELLW